MRLKLCCFTVLYLQLFPAKKRQSYPPNAFSVSIYLCDRRIWNESEKARAIEREGARLREEGERHILNAI